ncbi:hypothetical protein JNM87_01770 [Candidatus Saccharibacteria bacterium]|nr:hypothetical protein [Candidatus Saccharibacteria bacterium]
MSYPNCELLPCQPHPFSNDQWDETLATKLRGWLAAQKTLPQRAALVIGAGTLPYILDVLPSHIIVADLDNPL